MALQIGIVGLPNVGKSTLFNAVTRTRKAQAANYPFCTIDPNVGVVTVPDPRLEVLSKLSGSKKLVPAAIEFVDIAGLVKGASASASVPMYISPSPYPIASELPRRAPSSRSWCPPRYFVALCTA